MPFGPIILSPLGSQLPAPPVETKPCYELLPSLKSNNIHLASSPSQTGNPGRPGSRSSAWALANSRSSINDYCCIKKSTNPQPFSIPQTVPSAGSAEKGGPGEEPDGPAPRERGSHGGWGETGQKEGEVQGRGGHASPWTSLHSFPEAGAPDRITDRTTQAAHGK